MREFVIDLTTAANFEDFVTAFNRGFCEHSGGYWHGRSWDAFNDYLSWPVEEQYRLVFKGWKKSCGLNDEDRTIICDIFIGNPHVDVQFD